MRDRRRWFRFPVRGSRCDGFLKVGRREVPVRVQDESAEGFSVVANRHPRVEAGDVAQLRTASGWSEVRVVHVENREPAEADASTESTKGEAPFRLGLQRLRDLAAPEDQPAKMSWLAKLRPMAFLPSTVPTVVGGVLFALLVVGIPTVAIGLLWHYRGPVAKQLGRWVDHSPASSRPGSSDPTSKNTSPDWKSLARKPAAAAERLASELGLSSGAEDSKGLSEEDLPVVIRRLPGATAFLLNEVVETLELTDSQQNEIRQLFDSTVEALRQLKERWPYDTRQQRARKRDLLFQESRRRVLELLTDEQRTRWEAMRADPAQEPDVQRHDGPQGPNAP